MKYLFIDDFKFKYKNTIDCFGLCFIVINHTKYNLIKNCWDNFLKKTGWPTNVEFKGRYIFQGSGLKGELQNVWKEKEEIIIKNIEKFLEDVLHGENKKFEVYYFYLDKSKNKENYERVLLEGLNKLSKVKIDQKQDKNYCTIFLDSENKDIKPNLENVFSKLNAKFNIVEGSAFWVDSSNKTPGIGLADLYAYFAHWHLAKTDLPEPTLFDMNLLKKHDIKKLVNQKFKKNTPKEFCIDCNLD